VQDPYNVTVLHLLFLLPQWCLTLPPCGGATRHKETWIRLKSFLTSFVSQFKLYPFSPTWSSNSQMPTSQFSPWVCREYSWVVYALAPFSPAPTSFDTTLILTALHPKYNVYFSFFLKDYELDRDLEFSSDSFKLAFKCMSHLATSSHSGMVFEHL